MALPCYYFPDEEIHDIVLQYPGICYRSCGPEDPGIRAFPDQIKQDTVGFIVSEVSFTDNLGPSNDKYVYVFFGKGNYKLLLPKYLILLDENEFHFNKEELQCWTTD